MIPLQIGKSNQAHVKDLQNTFTDLSKLPFSFACSTNIDDFT